MTEVISINSKITIKYDDIVKTFTLVKSEELDSSSSKISIASPLGKLLIGSKANDTLKLVTPERILKFRVISIEN